MHEKLGVAVAILLVAIGAWAYFAFLSVPTGPEGPNDKWLAAHEYP